MYLEKFKSGKNTYIRLVECYRDPNTKTNRKKVIKNYGNYEKLVKQSPELLRELEEKYSNVKAKESQARNDNFERLVNSLSAGAGDSEESLLLNYSSLILNPIWRDILGMTEFFRYLNIDQYKTCGLEWRLGFIKIPYPVSYMKNEKAKDLLFDGDFYLLTSSGTFSSGMLYAQYVKDNNIGTIIGEAPGNDPNGYGEVVYFALPNSKIFMSVSTKHFIRVDKDAGTYLVEPDIECSSNEAMDKLYEVI